LQAKILGSGTGEPPANSEYVLVAQTPFEADAWASALRETKYAMVSAARERHWGYVKRLVRAGRDADCRDLGNKRTALHYAAGYGDLETAESLVTSGATVNARDAAGMTPLGWACLKGHVELAQLLLRSDADPLIKAHSGVLVGKTALLLARLHGTQSGRAMERAQKLRHLLLLHCGATCFQVSHLLGQGGFGKVMAVTRSDSGEAYAMKSILKRAHSNSSTAQKIVAQAQVERRILANIAHPFIIELHCAFQTHEKLLLVLQICPGGDLKVHVSRLGRFAPEVAAFTSAQVLLALEYLHSRHIIHRDLKLENVLLDGEGHVRLTDFNVAKLLEERRTYSMKGTLFCMAPEVILKKGHDAGADFWSLGVLIYEMVTGVPPFYSSDKAELKRMILGIEPHRTHLVLPQEMPTCCRMLISQLLVREQRTRLGARPQDIAIMKAHPFFGRLNWDAMLSKQLRSPLRDSVQLHVQSRTAATQRSKRLAGTAEQDLAPSSVSQQQSTIVQGWDYVRNGG